MRFEVEIVLLREIVEVGFIYYITVHVHFSALYFERYVDIKEDTTMHAFINIIC